MKNYYNKNYFKWQKNIGNFGGQANLVKFSDHINKNDKVIDFGCGGGYLLNNVNCKEKIGIEINSTAKKIAKKNGLKVLSSARSIKNNWADVIISNHALEHVENPLMEVRALHSKLKKNGRIIFVVPCDNQFFKYSSQDINKHLFSWSPMNLGNLFTRAGYQVISVSPFLHKWPSNYKLINKILGIRALHFFSWINGYLKRKIVQIKIVAIKK